MKKQHKKNSKKGAQGVQTTKKQELFKKHHEIQMELRQQKLYKTTVGVLKPN